MPYEVVSAYTLVVGEYPDDPVVSVHSTADEAWKALDREVRSRCRMRLRPRRVAGPDGASRLADAWRASDPESRYWQVTAHRLPILVPELGRRRSAAAS